MTQISENRFGGKRATVIGGSMAGLVATRVLADHFEEVTLVERDLLPEGPEHRKGVPQARHLHGILQKGGNILEDLLPGVTAALEKAGALRYDFGKEAAWYHFGGWMKNCDTGVRTIGCSRPLLESEVRRRVLALPNVRRRDDCEAKALTTSGDRRRITGITLARRDGSEETLEADLTVDATGRGTRLPRWLVQLGYENPPETQVKVNVAYGSRLYRVREGRPGPGRTSRPWKFLYVIEGRRLGVVMPLEGGVYMATLAGFAGDHPPSDPEGFLAFARSLPTGEIERALDELEPMGDIETYKFPANTRRHYEKMARFPEGLAVVGDAVASFNPIYGQGMTIATIDATVLGAALGDQRREHGPGQIDGLARRYLRAVARTVDVPWGMATGEDFRHPEVEGVRPPLFPVMKWYFGRVQRACTADGAVFATFVRCMHMLDGPEKLFAPGTVLRVLRSARAADAASAGGGASAPAPSWPTTPTT